MLIEDPDCLKGWLVHLLKPLCEADPEALAKYVMALVKKDKPEDELRKTCREQLQVFLQDNTADFVDTFFKAVSEKSYLRTQSSLTVSQTQQQSNQDPDNVTASGDQKSAISTNPTTTIPSVPSSSVPSSSSGNLNDVNDDSTGFDRRRRSRTRSRSPARKNTSGSSGRSGQRSDDFHRRNGSSRYEGSSSSSRRTRDMDRDAGKSFSSRRRSNSRSRSPSPSSRRRNPRSRSPPLMHESSKVSSRKRSLSKSPDRPDVGNKRKQGPAERCRDFDERGFCMRGDQCPFVASHSDPVVLDAEPFLNHNRPQAGPNGPAPALLPAPGTAGAGPAPPEYDPRHPGMDMPPSQRPPLMPMPVSNVVSGPNNNYPHPPPPVGQWVPGGYPVPSSGRPNLNVIIPDMQVQQQPQQSHGLQSTVTVVNNHGHHLHQQQQQQHPQMHMHHPNSHHVPLQNQGMMQMQPQQPHQMHHNGRGGRGRGGGFGGRGRGRGGFGRGGGMGMMSSRPHDQPERCTLEVRRLPAHLNTIATLNDYFSKFGTIVNLQIKYDNDPEAAVVQFASHAEAATAHRCPEAVLNNRFIKLFWHNKDQEKQDPAPEKASPTDEGTESDDRPADRPHGTEENHPNRNEAEDQDDDRNRIPAKERLDLNSKPLDADAADSFKLLQLPKPKPSRPVLNPNLLRKSNVEKSSVDNKVPMIKTKSEQKKEKLLKNIEIQKKRELLLASLQKDVSAIAGKLMSAKKEDISSLKKLFEVLDLKRKEAEDDLKKITEEILTQCGKRAPAGAGAGGFVSARKRGPAVIASNHHGQLVKNAVEIKKKMLDRELDQISESHRKTHADAGTVDSVAPDAQEAVADAEAAIVVKPDDAQQEQEQESDDLPSDLSDPLDNVNIQLQA